MKSLNQATPLLYFIFVAVFVSLVAKLMNPEAMSMFDLDPGTKLIEVDEDLPEFFECIKFSDANVLLAENSHMISHYQLEVILPQLVQRLQQVQVPPRQMQGTPWYNIMTNPFYAEMFSYMGPHIKHRENYIKDHDYDQKNNYLQSDVVNIILNLSTIPDEVAKKLDLNYFDSYFNKDFIGYMDDYKESFKQQHNKVWKFADD